MFASLRQYQPSIRVLLSGVLLSHLGMYLTVPILPIFLTLTKGMSIADTGLILAMSPLTFQLGSMLGGVLSDRIGRKGVIAAGAFINALALVGYAWFSGRSSLIGVGLASGLGIGLNAPATKAAIALIASEGNSQTSAFALRGIAANAGTAAAGVIAYFVFGGANSNVFYAAAFTFAVLGAGSWLLLPEGCGVKPCQEIPLRSYKAVLQNKPFLFFSLLSVIIWAIYTQFALAMPLRAESLLTDSGLVSLIWTVNSIAVIVFQSFISRWFLERTNTMFALSAGVFLIGAGLVSVFWANSFTGLILGGLLFIVGEMVIVPTMDSTVSRLGAASMTGMYFGMANVVSGIGEASGKYLGGIILGQQNRFLEPWMIYVTAASVIGVTLLAFVRRGPLRTMEYEQRHQQQEGYSNIMDFILGRKKER